MKNILSHLGNGAKLIVAVTIASIIGGATTAAVMAAIPNSDGSVNTCYNKKSGALKVIDITSGKTCTNKQTSLVLGTGNAQYAYAQLNSDGSLNTTVSHGISNYSLVPASPGSSDYVACFDVSINPSDGYVNISNGGGVSGGNVLYLRSQAGSAVATVDQYCGNDYNAVDISMNADPTLGYETYNFSFFR
jgi:hypothetical protein